MILVACTAIITLGVLVGGFGWFVARPIAAAMPDLVALLHDLVAELRSIRRLAEQEHA